MLEYSVNKTILNVVVRKKGKSLDCHKFNNDYAGHMEIITYLRKHNVTHVGLEATGYYHLDLALRLDDAKGIEVMIINPRASKNFAKAMMQRNKTNTYKSRDLLAQFTERMDFVKWTSPVGEVLDIGAYSRRLVSLSKEKTKAKNQLHAYSRTRRTPSDTLLLLHSFFLVLFFFFFFFFFWLLHLLAQLRCS